MFKPEWEHSRETFSPRRILLKPKHDQAAIKASAGPALDRRPGVRSLDGDRNEMFSSQAKPYLELNGWYCNSLFCYIELIFSAALLTHSHFSVYELVFCVWLWHRRQICQTWHFTMLFCTECEYFLMVIMNCMKTNSNLLNNYYFIILFCVAHMTKLKSWRCEHKSE